MPMDRPRLESGAYPPLRRRFARAPVDLDELDMQNAFAARDSLPLAPRLSAQSSRSLQRCVRLRRALLKRGDDAPLREVLRAEQRLLAMLRAWSQTACPAGSLRD